MAPLPEHAADPGPSALEREYLMLHAPFLQWFADECKNSTTAPDNSSSPEADDMGLQRTCVHDFCSTGRGLKAEQDFRAGEIMVRVPFRMLLRTDDESHVVRKWWNEILDRSRSGTAVPATGSGHGVEQSSAGALGAGGGGAGATPSQRQLCASPDWANATKPEDVLLLLMLLYEKHVVERQRGASFWSPFFAILPKKYDTLPAWFLQEPSDEAEARSQPNPIKNEVDANSDNGYRSVTEPEDSTADEAPATPENNSLLGCSGERVKKIEREVAIATTLWERILGPDGQEAALLGICLENFLWAHGTVWTRSCFLYERDSNPSSSFHCCLVPYGDLLNSHPGHANAKCGHESLEEVGQDGARKQKDFFVFRCGPSEHNAGMIKKGDQCFICYATSKTNFDLLLNYGFYFPNSTTTGASWHIDLKKLAQGASASSLQALSYNLRVVACAVARMEFQGQRGVGEGASTSPEVVLNDAYEKAEQDPRGWDPRFKEIVDTLAEEMVAAAAKSATGGATELGTGAVRRFIGSDMCQSLLRAELSVLRSTNRKEIIREPCS
eukprot:g4432.t1